MTTDLTVSAKAELLPSLETWDRMNAIAERLVSSGFLPSQIKTPAQALALMMKGRELGLPPMESFSQLYYVDGHIGMLATLMMSQIIRKCPGAEIKFLQRSSTICKIRASRPGRDPDVFEFTIQDAQRAGLLKGVNWQKYPRAMLRSRCVAEMARSMFPDCLSGVNYTPEELGAQVTINPATDEIETVDVETIEMEGEPVELFVGTPAQMQTVKTLIRGEGLDPERSSAFLAKIHDKPMERIPAIIARQAKKLRDMVNAGPTGQQILEDRTRPKEPTTQEVTA